MSVCAWRGGGGGGCGFVHACMGVSMCGVRCAEYMHVCQFAYICLRGLTSGDLRSGLLPADNNKPTVMAKKEEKKNVLRSLSPLLSSLSFMGEEERLVPLPLLLPDVWRCRPVSRTLRYTCHTHQSS